MSWWPLHSASKVARLEARSAAADHLATLAAALLKRNVELSRAPRGFLFLMVQLKETDMLQIVFSSRGVKDVETLCLAQGQGPEAAIAAIGAVAATHRRRFDRAVIEVVGDPRRLVKSFAISYPTGAAVPSVVLEDA